MIDMFQRLVWEMWLFLIIQEDISSLQNSRMKPQNKVGI